MSQTTHNPTQHQPEGVLVIVASIALFPLGEIAMTPGTAELFSKTGDEPADYLRRHAAGDWSELCDEDKQTNKDGIQFQGRIMSVYKVSNGKTIWIITEADRSVTTFLLPEEY